MTARSIFLRMMVRRANSRNNQFLQTALGEAYDDVSTVYELTMTIAGLMETHFSDIAVKGEVSSWSVASSGHTYFSLKDDRAMLSAVLWRGRHMPYQIETGMTVVVRGRISIYPPRGQYQLDAHSVVPIGAGDLQARFEALKRRLAVEGLFDLGRKKPLPPFPRRIGVATSRTGAAIHDILTTLEGRMPGVEVVLRSCLVQGSLAAADIADAIGELDRLGNVDVIIVGRGGGSSEDLWAFNEEIVARAIASATKPIVSAIGHESDITIADLVADVRAATPTAAAQLVVRDRSELVPLLDATIERITRLLRHRIDRGRSRLDAVLRSRGFSRPVDVIWMHGQRVDDLEHRARTAARASITRLRQALALMEAKIGALGPERVLARGFAIIERRGKPVIKVGELVDGDTVNIIMQDGGRPAIITSPNT